MDTIASKSVSACDFHAVQRVVVPGRGSMAG